MKKAGLNPATDSAYQEASALGGKMKIEISRIRAHDGNVEAFVRIELRTNGALTKNELFSVSKSITNNVADALRGICYTDFGPSNTVVRL